MYMYMPFYINYKWAYIIVVLFLPHFFFMKYILLRICQRVKQLFGYDRMHVYVFAIREIQQFNRWL